MLTPGRHRDTYVEEYHRKFFTNVDPRKCGGTDIHIGGLAHVGVLCAFFCGKPNIGREAVREHINLTHRAPEILNAADAMTRIISAVLGGSGLRETIFEYGHDWFSKRKAEQWSREPDEGVIGHRVSPACYIADAFPASLYLAWKYADDFEAGVIANANLGGDNCHRGAVLGAMLGAAAGTDLSHSPRQTEVRLKPKTTPVATWLTPDLHRTHERPSGQECRLRLKRPKSVFFNSFISSNLWKCDLEITQLYRTFLVTPGPSFLKPALKSTHNPG